MALSKSMLRGMGITDEQIQAIIDAHMESVTALQKEVETAESAKQESDKKLAKVQKDLDALKSETDEGKNPYKVKYEAVKEEYEEYKKGVHAKEVKATKEKAYEALLKECGVSDKRIKSIIRVSDIDSLELEEDGKIKDASGLKKGIKEEWSDFIPTEGTKGASISQPPSNSGGKMSKEDILAIKDTVTRQQAMLENKDLFI